jgi:hypothetical protein
MTAHHGRADKLFLTMLVLAGLIISGLSVAADWLGFDRQPGLGLAQILVLISGLSLSLISWCFLRSTWTDPRWIWPVVLASLLAVGLATRLVETTYDRLDYDEYACMVNVHQNFSDYVKGLAGNYSVQFLMHYWLSYRLLGDTLIAYRTMSLITGVSLLLLTTLWLRHFWPLQKAVSLVVLLVLILNANALYLARYAIFVYGNSLLVSAGLFFLFMRLAEGPLENRAWLWISAILLPAAFFSNLVMMVPLATGILSVIVFRWWRFADSRNLAGLWRWVWEFKPLLIFPFVYLIREISFPLTNLGADARPDMAHLFFPTSGHSCTFLGILEFVLGGTYSLFRSMLAPTVLVPAEPHNFILRAVVVAVWGSLAAFTFVQVARRRADQQTMFTAFFLLTTLMSIVVAGLLGVYPYGDVRYTPYLLMPCAILIGIGGSSVCRWVFQGLGLLRSRSALLAYLAVVILIAGSCQSLVRYRSAVSTKNGDDQAIDWLRSHPSDLVLADSYVTAILYTRAPEVYERVHPMGWGTYWGKDAVPSELAEVITGAGQLQPVESVLVALYYKDLAQAFPRWNSLLGGDFDVDMSVEGPNIWVGLYRRKVLERGRKCPCTRP